MSRRSESHASRVTEALRAEITDPARLLALAVISQYVEDSDRGLRAGWASDIAPWADLADVPAERLKARLS